MSEEFDLEKHLLETVGSYCEGMSEEEKEKLLNRIICTEGNKGIGGKKIYRLPELAPKKSEMFENLTEMKAEGKLLPETDEKYKKSADKINAMIKDFCNNDSKVSRDLKKLLEAKDTEIIIGIRKWGRINASAALLKKENESDKNTIVLMVAEEMFHDTPYNKELPGFLAHEFGHVLEFNKRPEGSETEYMDGAETSADIIGTQLAVNAGYDCRAAGEYMGKDFEENHIVYDGTPTGDFRRETMNRAHEMTTNSLRNKSLTDKKNEKIIAQRLRKLQGVGSPKKTVNTSRKTNLNRISLTNIKNIQKSSQR